MPLPQDAEAMFGVFFLTIKGLYVPAFIWQNFNIFFYSIVAAVIAIIVIRIHAKKVQESQGKQIPVFLISIGLIFILPLLSFLIGGVSLSFEVPVCRTPWHDRFRWVLCSQRYCRRLYDIVVLPHPEEGTLRHR